MSSFTPSVKIELGDREYMLKCGFGTVATFERVHGKPFFSTFGGGLEIRAVITLLQVGLKHHKKFSEQELTDTFDQHPDQFLKIVNEAIPYMVGKLMPEESKEGDEVGPQGNDGFPGDGTSRPGL